MCINLDKIDILLYLQYQKIGERNSMIYNVAPRFGNELLKKAALASTPLLAAKVTALAAFATSPPGILTIGAVGVGSYLLHKATKE